MWRTWSRIPRPSERFYDQTSKRWMGTRKRQRRSSTLTTKRDRLRLERQALVVTDRQGVNDLMIRAQGRLNFLKDKLYENWNPDHATRPAKQDLVMDGRWWLWNVTLALAPAVLIGLVCEFYVQHQMNDFFLEQEIETLRKSKGDAYVEAHWDDLHPPPPEGLWVRLYKAGVELQGAIEILVHGKDDSAANEGPDASKESSDAFSSLAIQPTATPADEIDFQSMASEEKIMVLLKRLQDLEQKVGASPVDAPHQSGMRQRHKHASELSLERSVRINSKEKGSSAKEVVPGLLDALRATIGSAIGGIRKSSSPGKDKADVAPGSVPGPKDSLRADDSRPESRDVSTTAPEPTASAKPPPPIDAPRPWWRLW